MDNIELLNIDDEHFFLLKKEFKIDDTHISRARLCKKQNKWIKTTSKTAKKIVSLKYLSKFGHHHSVPTITDRLNDLQEISHSNESYYELNHVIRLSPWSCSFKFDILDHEVIHILLKQFVIIVNKVFYISKLWCWQHFLNLKSFPLSCVDNEICVCISDFIKQTNMIDSFPNHDDFFENDSHEYSPSALDVVFNGDSIFIKVDWIWKGYLYTFP
jgi:hypothetical protein